MTYKADVIYGDFAVIAVETATIVCFCNRRRNAELIADILNGDKTSNKYFYGDYPIAKWRVKDNDKDDKH